MYELDIIVPSRYPHQAPTVKFVTRVFHPNIHWEVMKIFSIDKVYEDRYFQSLVLAVALL